MSCDYTETNGARNDSLNMENFAKDREQFFTSRRTCFIRAKSIVSRQISLHRDGRLRSCVFFKMNRRFFLIVRCKSCDRDLVGDKM